MAGEAGGWEVQGAGGLAGEGRVVVTVPGQGSRGRLETQGTGKKVGQGWEEGGWWCPPPAPAAGSMAG